MLSGKPIISSTRLIKDPVELSGCGLVVRLESSDSIIEAIMSLKAKPKKEFELIGVLGLNYVKVEHSIKNLSSKYLDILI